MYERDAAELFVGINVVADNLRKHLDDGLCTREKVGRGVAVVG